MLSLYTKRCSCDLLERVCTLFSYENILKVLKYNLPSVIISIKYKLVILILNYPSVYFTLYILFSAFQYKFAKAKWEGKILCLKNARGDLWEMLGLLVVSFILCYNSVWLIDHHDPSAHKGIKKSNTTFFLNEAEKTAL